MVTSISEQVLCEISKQGLWFLTETEIYLGRGDKVKSRSTGKFPQEKRTNGFCCQNETSLFWAGFGKLLATPQESWAIFSTSFSGTTLIKL